MKNRKIDWVMFSFSILFLAVFLCGAVHTRMYAFFDIFYDPGHYSYYQFGHFGEEDEPSIYADNRITIKSNKGSIKIE
jgi:hypothetical protein